MSSFVLRFEDLNREGHAYCFPCDEKGFIMFDALPPTMLTTYNRVVSRLGIDFATPIVVPID